MKYEYYKIERKGGSGRRKVKFYRHRQDSLNPDYVEFWSPSERCWMHSVYQTKDLHDTFPQEYCFVRLTVEELRKDSEAPEAVEVLECLADETVRRVLVREMEF